MIRFSIFGIPVEVQPFFWLSLVIIGGAIGADTAEEILQIALFVIAGFISILIHELGHALTARSFGASVRISLQAFGGYAAYTGLKDSRWRSFLITAAGPAIQIALGFLVSFGTQFFEFNDNMKYFVHVLIVISFFWAILNLIPVLPLDGGQMLNAAMGPKRLKITLWISIVVAVVCAVVMFTSYGSFIFPIFLAMFAWQAFQALKQLP
jgi:stage IV sporulation protein FB